MDISSFKVWLTEVLPMQAYNLLPKIIGAIVILVVGYFLSKFAGKLLIKIMKAKNVDETVHYFLRRMLVITIRVVFVVLALSAVGVNINSFVAALGAAGITAGLGLQSSISQFASGIEILFNKPFRKGDFIELEGVSGRVEEIHFMNTTLLTKDNKRVIVPNSHVTGSNIINYTAQKTRRIDLKFSISYNDSIDKAKAVIAAECEACPFTISDPAPLIAVGSHSASSIDIDTLVWCKSEDYFSAFYDMQERVKIAFDKNGVHIPYNQLDLHIVDNQRKEG